MMMGTGTMETASMPTATSSGISTSTSTSSSSSEMQMMNSYMTTDFKGYPVVFKTLSAASGGKAFGIFVILFFTAFAFRGLSFLSTYIEQRVFKDDFVHEIQLEHELEKTLIVDEESDLGSSTSEDSRDNIHKDTTTQPHAHTHRHNHNPHHRPTITDPAHNRSVLAKFLHFTPLSLYRDFIRLILTFASVMIGYALMLAVMSFVLPYFFAIVLGISFGEVFFFRLAFAMDILPPNSACSNVLH